MSNLLNPDNKFFTIMGKVFDMLVLNTIWLILCIPVITIVPATTALYYAVVKVIRRERSYVIKEFFRSFKQNFKQGAVLSVIAVIFVGVLCLDVIYAWDLVLAKDNSGSTFLGVFIVIAVMFCAMYAYLCPLLSRFEMKLGRMIKFSFIIAVKHLLTTVGLLVILAGVVFGSYITSLSGIFFLPVTGMLLSSFLIERVFKKYMPAKEEPEDGEEEAGKEKDEWYLE